MAVSWSWAFGLEDVATLEDMGWFYHATGSTREPQTGADKVYSYPAFPGTKYSWASGAVRGFNFPTAPFVSIGSVAVAVKADTSWYQSNAIPIIAVMEGAGTRGCRVYCSNTLANTITCIVGDVIAGTFTLTPDDWHYISINYDISTIIWDATFWANGVQVASGSNSGRNANTTGHYRTGGFSNTLALNAQVIVYDSGTTASDAAAPIFCTRVTPNADDLVQTVGTWAPSTGSDNFAVTNENPFDETTYTRETTPSSGDAVVTEATNLVTQLGITSSSVLGATNHTYSVGTGVTAFAGCRDSGEASFTTGTTIAPDAGDTTYAYATATAGLTGTSTIECQYKIV